MRSKTFLGIAGLVPAMVVLGCASTGGGSASNAATPANTGNPAAGLYLPGDVTLDLAMIAIDAGVKKAKEQGTLMNIAVVDAAGNLKAFARMEGAFLASIDISIKKAKTSRGLNMPTSQLFPAAQPGAELYGIEVTNDGLVLFGGGELLKDNSGTIIGAIGVSGSSVANDMAVAQAGAAAVLAATGGSAAPQIGSAKADDPAAGLYLPGDVTLDSARAAIDAGVKKAKEQGTLMNIAIIDAGGNLKAFARMEGAFLASIDISIKKAKTSRGLNMPTSQLYNAAQPKAELYGIEVTNDGLVVFGGGELLKDKSGTIIGAIGVSGSSVANDMAVAQAGAGAAD